MSSRHPQSTMPTKAINQRGSALVPGVGLFLLLALSIAWLAHAAQQPELTIAKAQKTTDGPVIPPAKGDQCVADTALMRTDHMDLLNHQRDDTVIRGIRNQPFSLVECVNCHAQTSAEGTPVRIDAAGQFCQSCHQYAAVKIDCFSCHAAIPEQASDQASSQTTEKTVTRTSDEVHGVMAGSGITGYSQPRSLLTIGSKAPYTHISSLFFVEQFGNDDDHSASN